jgi:hypothetical protein
MFDELAAAADETLPAGFDEPMEMIVDGSTIYMRVPMLTYIGGPSGWLSMNPEDMGMSSDALGLGAGTYDPSSIIESLRGAGGEPEVVGTEDVRGVETTHYRATVDLDDAIAQVPEDQRAFIEAQLEQLGDSSIPLDVWVDAEGLPRRMRLDMGDLLGQAMGAEVGVVMTMDFFDYGVPVDIQVPSPDEVQSFTDVLGEVGGMLGS